MKTISEHDQMLINEATKMAQEQSEKFFNYFGLRGEELEYARREFDEFLKDWNEAGMGRGFFDSPLGRKAFMVGFFRGRNTNRKDIDSLLKNQANL